MKLKYKIILGFFIVFLVVYITDNVIIPIVKYWSPERAIRIFKTRDCAEEQIINPLIVCGKRLLPRLTKEIRENKNMRRRIYAIIAIGHIGEQSSLQFLEELLFDQTEDSISRKCALTAMIAIDSVYAKKKAGHFVDNGPEYLSDFCRRFINEDMPVSSFKRKSYWVALCDGY